MEEVWEKYTQIIEKGELNKGERKVEREMRIKVLAWRKQKGEN